MNDLLPVVYVARHGETAWSLSGQHTGRTGLPLTPNGERNAHRLGGRLKGMTFQKVFTSPLQRASGPANWQDSDPWPKAIRISWNGTMVGTRGCARPRSWLSARIGNCSGMAVQAGSHRHK